MSDGRMIRDCATGEMVPVPDNISRRSGRPGEPPNRITEYGHLTCDEFHAMMMQEPQRPDSIAERPFRAADFPLAYQMAERLNRYMRYTVSALRAAQLGLPHPMLVAGVKAMLDHAEGDDAGEVAAIWCAMIPEAVAYAAELKAQIGSLCAERDQLRRERDNILEEATRYVGERSTAVNELIAADALIAELRAKNARLVLDAQQCYARNDELVSEHLALTSYLDKLTDSNSSLSVANERLRDENEALIAEKNALHDRLASLDADRQPQADASPVKASVDVQVTAQRSDGTKLPTGSIAPLDHNPFRTPRTDPRMMGP